MVLLGRFAQTRRIGPEAEPIPVIVDDALAAFPRHDKWRLLDLVARLGEASQVVYLTDDEETLEWARSRSVKGRLGLLAPEPAAAVTEAAAVGCLPRRRPGSSPPGPAC